MHMREQHILQPTKSNPGTGNPVAALSGSDKPNIGEGHWSFPNLKLEIMLHWRAG